MHDLEFSKHKDYTRWGFLTVKHERHVFYVTIFSTSLFPLCLLNETRMQKIATDLQHTHVLGEFNACLMPVWMSCFAQQHLMDCTSWETMHWAYILYFSTLSKKTLSTLYLQ